MRRWRNLLCTVLVCVPTVFGCGDQHFSPANLEPVPGAADATPLPDASGDGGRADGSFVRTRAPLTTGTGSFRNPVLATPSADPSIVFADGFYFAAKSYGSGIHLLKSETLAGLQRAAATSIVNLPPSGGFGDNCDLWAPELRLIDSQWWVYYAASSNIPGKGCTNASHRMYAARATSNDPTSTWTRVGRLAPPDSDHWAIDGTTLQMPDGRLYFVWSGTAEGQPDGGFPQQLFIAPMSNPQKISGSRVMISSPSNSWEQLVTSSTFGWINEGPEAIVHDGVASIVFSANASWDNRYSLGITTLRGTDPLDPRAWRKNDAGPIFSQNFYGWGVGHHTFFNSPDGTEQWIAFHSFNAPGGGWDSREVRAQRIIGWNADHTPNLGSPVADGIYAEPSRRGEGASFGTYRKLYNPNSGLCLDLPSNTSANGASMQLWTCNGFDAQRFRLESASQKGRIRTKGAGKCLDVAGASKAAGSRVQQWDCNGGPNQDFSLSSAAASGAVSIAIPFSNMCLDVQNAGTAPGTPVRQWTCNGSVAQQWVVLESSFDDGAAYGLASFASGKCVDVINGSSTNGAIVRQWTCNDAPAQRYRFEFGGADPAGAGVYSLVNAASGKCVDVTGKSQTPGAQIQQYQCLGPQQTNQQWSVAASGDHTYTLVARHSGQNLDLAGGNAGDDAKLQQWPANGLSPQRWVLLRGGD